jgi:hypothetical protein
LHERVFVVPAVQVAVCLLSWVIDDVALALVLSDGLGPRPGNGNGNVAKGAFDVVARTRNPAAITAATVVNNFVVLMFVLVDSYYRYLYKNVSP